MRGKPFIEKELNDTDRVFVCRREEDGTITQKWMSGKEMKEEDKCKQVSESP